MKRKSWMKRGGPLRRKSKKRQALEPKVRTDKSEWSDSLPHLCWVCGRTDGIQVHHMLRGHLARMEKNDKPWAWFKICLWCHDDHWHNTSPAKQLAIKRHYDEKHYNREAFLIARNDRALDFVTEMEVDEASSYVGFSGGPQVP